MISLVEILLPLQITAVDGVLEYAGNRFFRPETPLFRRNLAFLKSLCYPSHTFTFQIPLEYLSHHLRFLSVYNELAIDVIIAVRYVEAEQTISHLCLLLHTYVNPLSYLLRFELCYPLDDIHDKSTHRGRCIQGFCHRDKFLVVCSQLFHHQHEILGISVNSVHLYYQDSIPFIHLLHHLLISRSSGCPSGVSIIYVLPCYLPSPCLTIGSELI